MFSFLNNIMLTDTTTGDKGGSGNNIVIYIIIGLVVVAAVVLLIMSNVSRRKQQKESEKQKSSLKPGDVVETVGGIIGKIIAVRPSVVGGSEFVIETGEEGRTTTLTVDIQALYRIISQVNAPAVTEAVKPAVSKPDVDGTTSVPEVTDAPATENAQASVAEKPASSSKSKKNKK